MLLFPFFFRWWIQVTSRPVFRALLLLYFMQGRRLLRPLCRAPVPPPPCVSLCFLQRRPCCSTGRCRRPPSATCWGPCACCCCWAPFTARSCPPNPAGAPRPAPSTAPAPAPPPPAGGGGPRRFHRSCRAGVTPAPLLQAEDEPRAQERRRRERGAEEGKAPTPPGEQGEDALGLTGRS